MLRLTRMAGLLAAMALAVMWVAPAQAQATRTWISGVGDDANPCSRTAPCKTFPGAISKTAAGGEIDCLDPGGFGAVTIVKSITLDCGGGIGGQVGSILASGTNGVTINAPTNAIVKIRNMTINGIQASGSAGLSGIQFRAGGALIVEHVGIFGFGGSTGNNGGVDFEPGLNVAGNSAKLEMVDVETQFNLGDGVLIKASNGGIASATLVRVSAINNTGSGVRVDNTNLTSGNGVSVSIFDSNASGNGTGVSVLTPAGTVAATVSVTHSVIAQNTVFGLLSSGTNASIIMGTNAVIGNATGMAGAGALKSYQDNYFYNGATGTSNGTPSATLTKL
jgi:hypothetical protein